MAKYVDGLLVPISLEVSDGGVSINELIGLLRKRLIPISIAVVLGTGIALAATFFIEPVYRATIVFLPVTEEEGVGSLGGLVSQLGGLSALAGIGLPTDDNNKVIGRAALESRQFITDFIAQEGLMPILFADRWDTDKESWISDDDIPSIEDGYLRFVEHVMRLEEDRQTGLITLDIEWTDPKLAASWANKLVQGINQAMRAKAIDEATKSIAYLNEQLEQTKIVEIRLAIYGLLERQIQQIMLAKVRDEYVFEVVDQAFVPDHNKYVWPIWWVILVLGFLLSLIGSAGIALFLDLPDLRGSDLDRNRGDEIY